MRYPVGAGAGDRAAGRPHMHVGMATVFQNPYRERSDYDVYKNELRLADQAEPLGFESIWGVEHHFTDYTMCPDVLQFLTYMAGRVKFDGFRLSMDESRERFVESAEMLLRGLETGHCEYAGTFVRQPRAAIRPAPFKSFRGRTYAAAVSPESMPIMAKLGVGILVIPQKPWPEVAKELDTYRATYREINRAEAPTPVCAGWTFC